MRNFARKIAVYYLALMFMGRKYQERVKNSFSTPSTAAVGFLSTIVMMAVMVALRIANNHGYFSPLGRIPRRVWGYPAFFFIYFIHWKVWRIVSQPDFELGNESRELAESLPFWTILLVFGFCFALFGLYFFLE